jgi:DNA-3-methyladenine glycosylase
VTPEAFDAAVLTGAVEDVARGLLGALLVRDDAKGRRVVRVVETEAYGGSDDLASHARAGRTRRTAVMFGSAGLAYVYQVYGLHYCLNVVCGSEGEAAAVLIRAAEPIEGLERMRVARGILSDARDDRLCAGPALLCRSLDVDRSLDGLDLLRDRRLHLATDGSPRGAAATRGHVVTGPRVGVAYAGSEWATRPWRFGLAGHAALSRPFAAAV